MMPVYRIFRVFWQALFYAPESQKALFAPGLLTLESIARFDPFRRRRLEVLNRLETRMSLALLQHPCVQIVDIRGHNDLSAGFKNTRERIEISL